MGGSSSLRKALALGSVLAATALGVSLAIAQEGPPVPVNFNDPEAVLTDGGATLDVEVQDDSAARFAQGDSLRGREERPRRLELELAAGGGDSPIDVSVAQRASLGANADGEIDRQGSGSEVRIGQGLVERREGRSGEPSVYAFVASDDEALTWQPGARSEFGGRGSSIALEDRVDVGDLSAGVTYERNGVQASLAYVERKESTRIGRRNFSHRDEFAGVTVTMRR